LNVAEDAGLTIVEAADDNILKLTASPNSVDTGYAR
jgi:hypothetical protein